MTHSSSRRSSRRENAGVAGWVPAESGSTLPPARWRAMRNKHSGSSLSIRAIAGTHVVVLAWDLKPEKFDTTPARLRRRAHRVRRPARTPWSSATSCAASSASRTRTRACPPARRCRRRSIRSSRSSGATTRAKPATDVPLSGRAGLRQAEAADAADDLRRHRSRSTTERARRRRCHYDLLQPRRGGLAGLCAEVRRIPTPNASDPPSPQMKWLSRGLFEALTEFIGAREGRARYTLRATLYEFHYEPVGERVQGRAGPPAPT